MAWAGGFFGSLGSAAMDAAKRNREKEQAYKDYQVDQIHKTIASGTYSPLPPLPPGADDAATTKWTQENAHRAQALEEATQQAAKLQGGSKPIKEIYDKFHKVAGLVHKHAGGQGGGQAPAQMTPPPATNAASASGATAPPAAVPTQAPPTLTKPPAFSMASAEAAGNPSPEARAEQATQMEIVHQREVVNERKRVAKEVGSLPEGSPEWKEYVYGIKPSTLTAPKTLDEAWLKSFADEHGREPTPAEIEGHYEAVRQKPIDQLIAEGIAASKAGDDDAAKQKFDLASKAAGAKKGPPSGQSILGVIAKANSGDPDAQKQLKTYVAMQNDLAKTRGLAFGMGRAMYQIGAYYDDQGNLVPMTNFDAANAIKAGRQITPAGHLSPKDAIAVQQFSSEMDSVMKGTPEGPGQPGIPPLRDNLGAFDNTEDRAIFARILGSAGTPQYGNESTWLGNVLNQAATSELSPEGQKLVVSLKRLNETVGRMRSVLGLPSTDNAMSMTLALVPGPQTPDSAFAGMVLDNLEQMGKQAIGIPTYRGLTPPAQMTKPPAAGAPPVGTVKGGYRFKGGDPAEKSNWEKVKPKAAAAPAAAAAN